VNRFCTSKVQAVVLAGTTTVATKLWPPTFNAGMVQGAEKENAL
jgi:hypothetical protein